MTLAQIDEALKRIQDGSVASVNGINPNLLDNAYFANPVNQRGQTEYSGGGYAIDRWKLSAQNVVAAIDDSGITVTNSQTWRAGLTQLVEVDLTKALIGKTVTASALVRVNSGNMQLAIGKTYTSAMQVESPAFRNSEFSLVSWTFVVPSDTTSMVFFMAAAAGASFTVKAVKLELGNTQTMARKDASGNWVLNEIPDYGERLARCQRYQLVLDCTDAYEVIGSGYATSESYLRLMIPTPVSLRAVPAFSHTLTNFDAVGAGSSKTLMNAAAPSRRLKPHAVLIYYSGLSGLATNETYMLQAFGGKIILDANL